jgi:serine/threonine protein kinase
MTRCAACGGGPGRHTEGCPQRGLDEATRYDPGLALAAAATAIADARPPSEEETRRPFQEKPRSEAVTQDPSQDGSPAPSDEASAVDLGPPTSPVAAGLLADSEQLHPGTMVGEYRVERKLGEGGMGAVYGATHPVIAKRAAIKVIKPHLGGAAMIERFIREARAVNQIGHPNIVDVFSFGTRPDGRPFLAMEWLQGESLATRIERGPIALPECAEILYQVSSALEAAHLCGVIHRDLKPENVFLVAVPNDDRPLVKLLDFGLAKLTEPKDDMFLQHGTRPGALVGTPLYASPEQARGLPVDHRADIYSLGVLAYEMLVGEPPFDAESPVDIVLKHVTEPPPSARASRPEIPEAVDALLVRMMDKDPNRRSELAQLRKTFAPLRERTGRR